MPIEAAFRDKTPSAGRPGAGPPPAAETAPAHRAPPPLPPSHGGGSGGGGGGGGGAALSGDVGALAAEFREMRAEVMAMLKEINAVRWAHS